MNDIILESEADKIAKGQEQKIVDHQKVCDQRAKVAADLYPFFVQLTRHVGLVAGSTQQVQFDYPKAVLMAFQAAQVFVDFQEAVDSGVVTLERLVVTTENTSPIH